MGDGAVVSDDHAGEATNVAHLALSARGPRLIAPEEVQQHNGQGGASFWAVIDGFVVEASEMLKTHPGGLRKLLSTDQPATGATSKAFGFSFSRGRNAHFPDTGKRFSAGVKKYLGGTPTGDDPFLPPVEVDFPPHGKIVVLGKLQGR